MSAGDLAPPDCSHEGCITCGDEALPLTVRRIDAERGLALCDDEAGRAETVEIALVGEIAPGDTLLVHAGTAIAHIGPATGVAA